MLAFVLGTKAELIKTAPLMKELEKRNYEYLFIHTGHHDLREMCEEFDVKMPDIILFQPPKTTSRFFLKTRKALSWGFSLGYKLLKTLKNIKNLELVLTHGDTITTGTTAVISSLGRWKVGHLEAGLRSYDWSEPFPEEFIRQVTDRFSHYLFAVSQKAVENLKRENVKGSIFLTGNTIVDSVYLSLKKGKRSKRRNHVVINVHRNENLQSKYRMKRIVEIIKLISLEIYWPIHDNTKYALKKYGLWEELKSLPNIEFSPLLSYFDFLQELKACRFILTDGGSIQEESLVLRKPCVILRRKTERVEGISTGINFLTKLNIEYSKKIIERLEGKFKIPKFENPYGKPGVSKRIGEIIEGLV